MLAPVIAMVVGCGDPAPGRGGTLAAIRQRGEITWGGDVQGGEPYVYEDPDHSDHVIGFEVDVMDAVARRLGVRARMVQYAWSNLVPSLERGDFDVIANGLEATAERRERAAAARSRVTAADDHGDHRRQHERSLERSGARHASSMPDKRDRLARRG